MTKQTYAFAETLKVIVQTLKRDEAPKLGDVRAVLRALGGQQQFESIAIPLRLVRTRLQMTDADWSEYPWKDWGAELEQAIAGL